MTIEQQRKMLECAAKSCGVELDEETREPFTRDDDGWYWWNPLTNPADTAVMCAKLDIGTEFHSALGFVVCRKSIELSSVNFYKDHDNSRLKAWMFAATMCAAKTQGYEDAHP